MPTNEPARQRSRSVEIAERRTHRCWEPLSGFLLRSRLLVLLQNIASTRGGTAFDSPCTAGTAGLSIRERTPSQQASCGSGLTCSGTVRRLRSSCSEKRNTLSRCNSSASSPAAACCSSVAVPTDWLPHWPVCCLIASWHMGIGAAVRLVLPAGVVGPDGQLAEERLADNQRHSPWELLPPGIAAQTAAPEAMTLEPELRRRMLTAVQVHVPAVVPAVQVERVVAFAACAHSAAILLVASECVRAISVQRNTGKPQLTPAITEKLPLLLLQAAGNEDRFVIFVAAPTPDEQYVSKSRRTQHYNRLVRRKACSLLCHH